MRTFGPIFLFCAALPVSAATYQPAVQVGTVSTSAIDEASGLAVSHFNPGILWTHNDSGDSARLFALATNGTLLRTFNFSGVVPSDWEDMAIGPGPVANTCYLYAGDIGDNDLERSSVQLYRVPEPVVTAGATTTLTGVETINLVYPNGARNAETLLIDPVSGDLFIVTKNNSVNEEVYRASAPLSTSSPVALQLLGTIGVIRATGGSVAADGSGLIVRTLSQAFQFNVPVGGTLAQAFGTSPEIINLQSEPQGEAIAFSKNPAAPGFYTTSEETNQPIYFYAAIPEPAAMGSFLISTLLLAGRRRRR